MQTKPTFSLRYFWALAALATLAACAPRLEGMAAYPKLIVGDWQVQKMQVQGETITAEEFMEDLRMSFYDNNSVVTRFPGQASTEGRYYVQGDKVIDPAKAGGGIMNIQKLDKSELVLAFEEKGVPIVFHLRRR